MSKLKERIHDEATGIDYILAGDYYVPAIELAQEDDRSIGKWGRMHRAYLEETNRLLLNHLVLTGKLHPYLADLNEQAQERCQLIIRQFAAAEGVDNDLKRWSQWEWLKAMNVGRNLKAFQVKSWGWPSATPCVFQIGLSPIKPSADARGTPTMFQK